MERRLAELHISRAIDSALRLFSISSSIIPIEFKDRVSDQIIVEISEFALHARRVNEICDFRKFDFSTTKSDRWNTSGHQSPLEDRYQNALNRLIHAKSLTVGYSQWGGEKIFLSSQNNIIPSYLEIETDRLDAKCVSIFGVSFCFLTEVIIKIKEEYPELAF